MCINKRLTFSYFQYLTFSLHKETSTHNPAKFLRLEFKIKIIEKDNYS